jgi:hypothetical protein
MENKELLKQLSGLKSIVPDSDWKERNREILLSQISNSEVTVSAEAKGFANILILPQKLARVFSTPSWAVFFVCVLVLSGSVFSVGAAHLSKPDSSLYIARIISEKARLAVTFNKEEKTKLSFKFASDHAKDITEILANTDLNDETAKNKTEKLTENFKQEIKVAKNKLKEMKVPEGSIPANEGAEDANIFSANLGRDEKGVQIAEPENPNIEIAKRLVPPVAKNTQEEKATTTPVKIESTSPSDNAHKVLEEAEDLFNVKDYGGALNKLQEANNIMENVNVGEKGEVKGASEGATTTVEK